MKKSNILIGLLLVFAMACTNSQSGQEHVHEGDTHTHSHDGSEGDHGHSHADGEYGHEHPEHKEQEEFTITGDSIETVTDSTHHVHEDGSVHPNH